MVTIQTHNSVTCIYVEGRLDTLTAGEFDRVVAPLLPVELHMVVDLTKCTYLSSFGIRSLLMALKALKAREGGQLILTGVPTGVFQVIEMAGLDRLFTLIETTERAVEVLAGLTSNTISTIKEAGPWRFTYQDAGIAPNTFYRWHHQGIAGYDELAFAVGRGVSAEMDTTNSDAGALFVATGHAAGFVPYNKDVPADFRVTTQPTQAGIFVEEAVSAKGKPHVQMQLSGADQIPLTELLHSVKMILQQDHPNVPLMLVIIIDQSRCVPSLTLGVQTFQSYHNNLDNNKLTFLHHKVASKDDTVFVGARFVLNTPGDTQRLQALDDFLTDALSFDNILDVQPVAGMDQCVIDSLDDLVNPLVWIFMADKLVDASDHRIQIHAGDEFFGLPHKAFLTRRLYADSARLELQQLQGGFSAQTFQVASYDEHGRRLRPTVLKIADRAMITRESERCKQYAMPYILNNSAMVLGAEFLGDIGALRYNFVGIGGEQSRLKWLTHYYKTWPLQQLETLFDKIFMQILHPWYGQSLQKTIQPFWDHNPTRTFFPHVFDEAQNVLGVSADEPAVVLHETGETLLNPYWYLKHEYPRLHSWTIDYPTSICHGDLNMQNILLDEDMNVYLIDFSETRPRSVVSDFARLEAIFLTEHTTLLNDADFLVMAEVANRLYSIDRLDKDPSSAIEADEATWKSVRMIMRMRQYAQSCAGGDASMVSYYIALLEWLLPIVCYSSVPHIVKRLSMIASAKICENLQQLLAART